MTLFNLKPCREVGELKKTLKDSVLDNSVPNETRATNGTTEEKGI